MFNPLLLSPCLSNLYAEYIMKNARIDEAQAGIKIVGRTINNLRYADDCSWGSQGKNKYEKHWAEGSTS